MTTRITKAFTEYFGAVEPIALQAYDNDKYVSVQRANGVFDSIKRGYVYADEALTRKIPEVQWHLLGGGTLKSYRPRVRRTSYDVFFPGDLRRSFRNKADALNYAAVHAAALDSVMEVSKTHALNTRTVIGVEHFVCMPSGLIFREYGRTRVRGIKYVRGHGKAPRALRRIVRRRG